MPENQSLTNSDRLKGMFSTALYLISPLYSTTGKIFKGKLKNTIRKWTGRIYLFAERKVYIFVNLKAKV
jgi:hypothetical protein